MLLSWCNHRNITLQAQHIPGRLNMIANKLFCHNQVIQTEWSLHQEVFSLLCQRLYTSEVDLFATRYNNKLPKFVSPVPDPQAWAMDALSFSWEDLDLYAFPPISLPGNVVNKPLSHDCKRLILIAPGWPNMPWFWDLVQLSVQILLCLPQHPNLVVQPMGAITGI